MVLQYFPVALLIGLLLFIPIPKAGMMSFAPVVLIVTCCVFFAVTVWQRVLSPDHRRDRLDLRWLLVWGCLTIWVALQLWVFPSLFGWGLVMPSAEVGDTFLGEFNVPVFLFKSLQWWALFCCYWAIAWGVSRLPREQVNLLMLVIVATTFFQAAFGLSSVFTGQTNILGLWTKEFYLPDATGTFVNRNHFAGFMEIGLPLSLHYLLFVLKPRDATQRWALIGAAVVYFVVVMLALLTTHSRMGFVAGWFGVGVWLLFVGRQHILERIPRFNRYGVIIVSIAFLLLLLVFGFSELLERFVAQQSGFSRSDIRKVMFDMPVSAWLWGIQPGVFAEVFPLFSPAFLRQSVAFAHNDYLQTILELGLFGCVFIGLSALPLLRALFVRRDMRWSAGAFGVVAAMLLHSTVDFNLHIPANAVYFWVAIGIILSQSVVQSQSATDSSGGRAFSKAEADKSGSSKQRKREPIRPRKRVKKRKRIDDDIGDTESVGQVVKQPKREKIKLTVKPVQNRDEELE